MSISDRLDEITARADAATDGPWVVEEQMGGTELIVAPSGHAVAYNEDGGDIGPPNSEFIAHARTDVPRLIAAVRAVLDVCDRTEASIIPRGDFETGQKSVTLTIRATIANALGENTP